MADKKDDNPDSSRVSGTSGTDYAMGSSIPPIRSTASVRRGYGKIYLFRVTPSKTNTYADWEWGTGTLDAYPFESSAEVRRDESTQEDFSSRAFTSSSTAPDRPRKPSVTRRMSSKRQVPHKGQEFSTDDDVKEVEEDFAFQQPSPRIRPLRAQSSTLRRRPSARPSAMTRDDSDNLSLDETILPDSNLNAADDAPSIRQADGGSEIEGGDESHVSDDEGAHSDAESFTLKDRQQAINETHPFGIRIWKPALYKKSRSVEKTAEGDIHSSPGGRVNPVLFLINLLWSVLFGWWLALAALLAAVACFFCAFSPSAVAYGRVFAGLSRYLLYPFGSFVLLETEDLYAEEDEGEGRSISEYEQWQNGDLEHGRLFFGPRRDRSLVGRRRNSVDSAGEQDSLLGRPQRGQREDSQLNPSKRRLFGRGEWTLGRVVFFVFFYFLVGPLMLIVSLVCWLLVFWIPMGRVTTILVSHLRRHPLALSFHSDTSYSRRATGTSSPSILLCTYRAAGTRYWKYTIDGTNVFFINLLALVVFVIFDYYVLDKFLGIDSWLTHPGLIFTLSLFSIIPLAYFIGQAVASISAQSSMGLGAAINAFFSTIVEVYLYCVALTEGKSQLVEGSIIGSIFAGILFLPGLSMCFGAIKRKTQRFNVKSAGVTSTMLLFAMIALFGPTLFYQVYGSHELNCHACIREFDPESRDCRRCYFSQSAAVHDTFFEVAVQPYAWFCAVFLFLSYIIGLWFTLRTHAALIWATENEEKEKKAAQQAQDSFTFEPRHLLFPTGAPEASGAISSHKDSIRESQLYKRILGQSLRQVGLEDNSGSNWEQAVCGSATDKKASIPHLVPPRSSGDESRHLSKAMREDNERLVRQVTELAATAAAVAARDATRSRKYSTQQSASVRQAGRAHADQPKPPVEEHEDVGIVAEPAHGAGGHDAPNWSKAKSSIILLSATLLYAIIAEILVNTVDVVLESVDIDEKFLGITLFALVPNTTEFLNAISFAMNGNIALSMEIGSAYALQVCLLQVPAVVLFSAFYTRSIDPAELVSHSFNLIFPQWDMITVILCVFLLSYVYGEGKSNYFKGSVLVLTYLVVVIGFYLSGYSNMDFLGVDRFDTLALGTSQPEKFHTIGRSRSGAAF
ncbi:Low affinity vacuolar monovalent cation/H(+) antiporter [Penicillium canariense]|uniref:Low affinity vacuolar monovalent cation/H(+) antiporter n=1 Tax=Penicillium canariense TaxID=189055 RepID=A0A9W9IEZ6_9EURO|nr:Low affinity vacuolar monovalent cation/H(+) antiporter [Penicillium canariense]KAJ5175483.1 Low affinity vacuolar monovalent cation/H(+) antiporter [Penicillium canariense]